MAGRPARVPPLHRRHVRRPRLTRRLDGSRARLILFVAPPGYGKTSLACEWLEDRPDAGWLRCTAAHADVAAFSVAVAGAVSHIAPGAADRLRQRLTVPDSPEAAVRPLAEMLAEALAGWPDDAWLAIDDYHLAMGAATVDDFMDTLLEAAPLKVIATSRRRPHWATARRRLQGEVLELTSDSLAMTDDEAAEALEGRSSEAIERLVALADGWPAVIGLAAITASESIPSSDVASELYRYFAEEVLRHEEPDLQALLLRAAVPPTIDHAFCAGVLGIDDPSAFLGHLVESGLAAEIEPGRVAFHPLLRDFLVRRLEGSDRASVVSVRLHALERARSERRWAEAFELARSGDGPVTMAAIVAEAADDLLSAGQIETLESWLLECGPEAERQAATRLARAETLYRRRRLGEAEALARDIADGSTDDPSTTSRAWCLAGRSAHLRSRPHEALELHRQAEATARTPADRSNALWGSILASLELEAGADDYLGRLLELEPTTDLLRVRIGTARAMKAMAEGKARQAHECITRISGLLPHLPDPTVRSVGLAQWAYVEHVRCEFEASFELAREALELCRTYRLEFAEPFCVSGVALAALGRRDLGSARAAIASLHDLAASADDAYVETLQRCLRVRLAITERRLETALALVRYEIPGHGQPAIRGELMGMGAVVAAALGHGDDAHALAGQAVGATHDAYAHAFAALAPLVLACRAGDATTSDPGELIEQLLESEFLDPLVVAYRAFPAILRSCSRTGSLQYRLDLLLRRSGDQALAREIGLLGPLSSYEQDVTASLTPREAEVLALVRLGLSNGEIAGRLVISPATAKVHVRHILRKLGVRTRLQAALWDGRRGPER